MKKLIALSLAGAGLFAAGSANIWTSADIMKGLKGSKVDSHKISGMSLSQYPGYKMSISKREASGIPELHQKVDDIFVVESGECTLVTGGKIVGAKTTEPNEVRGQAIEGGTKRSIATGDVIRIPANMPHQMLLDEGKQITYAVVKVDGR